MKLKANELLLECLKQLKPPEKLTVTEWADKYRFLSQESSAEPGKYRSSRTPYAVEIMDALSDKRIKKVVWMASSQVGKTELLLNVSGYYIHYDPCPILLVQPTDEMAQGFSKERIAPMFRDTPVLREINKKGLEKKKGQKKATETILQKKFPGGQLTMIGSNAPSKLASRPIRVVLIDECDRYKSEGVGGEGDSIKLAEKRTKTFWNKKIFIVSTPGIAGKSQIEREYNNSDQRRYYIPCPNCNEFQILEWKNVKWEGDDYQTAAYFCPHCGEEFPEERKMESIKNGYWKAHAPLKETAGFHINELYSPWAKFSEIVKDFIEAKKGGKPTLQTWVNTSLGETWKEKEGDTPDWKLLYQRRDSKLKIGSVPNGAKLLTAAIDVQKDRIEYEIIGWGDSFESWSIQYDVVEFDTSNEDKLLKEVEKIINIEPEDSNETRYKIAKIAIDSSAFTQTIYSVVRRINDRRLIAIKGSDSQQIAISLPKQADVSVKKGKTIRNGVKYHIVGSSILKDQVYSWLKRLPLTPEEIAEGKSSPTGLCHFPEYDEEYFKMLTAEIHTYKVINGFKKYYWEKIRNRNEALDIRVYNIAALESLGYKRWKLETFNKYAEKFQSPSEPKRKIIKRKKKKKTSDFLDGYV